MRQKNILHIDSKQGIPHISPSWSTPTEAERHCIGSHDSFSEIIHLLRGSTRIMQKWDIRSIAIYIFEQHIDAEVVAPCKNLILSDCMERYCLSHWNALKRLINVKQVYKNANTVFTLQRWRMESQHHYKRHLKWIRARVEAGRFWCRWASLSLESHPSFDLTSFQLVYPSIQWSRHIQVRRNMSMQLWIERTLC